MIPYKPRTYRYKLNSDLLSFRRTDRGDIILNSNEYLSISLPPRSVIYAAVPNPNNVDSGLPMIADRVVWSNQVLVKFSFVFDVEQSIGYEISSSIHNLYLSLSSLFEGENGIFFSIIVVVLVVSYLLLRRESKRLKGG